MRKARHFLTKIENGRCFTHLQEEILLVCTYVCLSVITFLLQDILLLFLFCSSCPPLTKYFLSPNSFLLFLLLFHLLDEGSSLTRSTYHILHLIFENFTWTPKYFTWLPFVTNSESGLITGHMFLSVWGRVFSTNNVKITKINYLSNALQVFLTLHRSVCSFHLLTLLSS